MHAIFPVSAGSTTFYLVGQRNQFYGAVRARKPHLTIMYFPSAYGIVGTD
jgi:hypothetical protein